MDKITNSWYFSDKGVGGKTSGNIKEIETWFINQFGVDDSQIMLKAETVKKMFDSFKKAKENNKPFRFNLRINKTSFWKRVITNGEEQLQIRFLGEYVENYDESKIESAGNNYFELYYNWKDIPEEIKKSILNKK